MRAWLYGVLSNSVDLANLVGDRIYQAGTLSATPDRPYVVFKVSTTTPRLGGAARQSNVQVWGHDDPDDYATIDDILAVVQSELEAQPGAGEFIKAEWQSDSDDAYDDVTGTITKFSRYQLINTS